MPQFTYDGDAGRVYPTLNAPASTPGVGESYELDEAPTDGRWVSDDGSTVVAPVESLPDEHEHDVQHDETDPEQTPSSDAVITTAPEGL